MKNLWNPQEAAGYTGDLALRVYTSRLLGREPALVLHGGGNTSVKLRESDIFGNETDLLYVKGSGWDLATIESAGFSPVHLDHLRRLATLPTLNDIAMVNELRTHMTQASAPTPSVEAILHAIIPHKYVDHTHADAIISITNTEDGLARIRELYPDGEVVIIPYIMPGFDLARLCGERFAAEATERTIGMVLMNHGIFSFGEDARTSYERMIELVSRAEEYLAHRQAWTVTWDPQPSTTADLAQPVAELRRQVAKAAGHPVVVMSHRDDRCLGFARHHDLSRISQQGPATPDHVIRTKRLPLLGRDVERYTQAYREYFAENAPLAKEPKTMLDPAPRVIIDTDLGICSVGRSAREADIIADIYQQTIDIILRAEGLGGWQALPAKDIFDVEYWDLEQAKLKKAGKPAEFSGEIALVTGAASGIGKACVEALLSRGAAVVGLDIAEAITSVSDSGAYRGLRCDVTDEAQVQSAIAETVLTYGGLDMLILNAGAFPPGCAVASLDTGAWQRVLELNLTANLRLLRETHPYLRLAPNHGRVVIIGSKNVAAPGPGAAAYSASKAALNQLARVAALEWGADGIRINTLHPDAVFDTGIWTEEVLASRARHYGMTVAEYKTKNILRTEISSTDVAALAAAMCGPLFAKTTGAQLPVDGGNDRVI